VNTEQNQDGKRDGMPPQTPDDSAVRWRAVSCIKTPPFSGVYADAVRETLHRHGCIIEEYKEYVLVTFPTGTRKRASHLQTLHERYRIVLPDGYELREICGVYRGLSVLALLVDG
jgi:hypothetical protein